MLQNPVTSTPFSVKDILRLEREQIGLEALQLQGARRSPESSGHLRQVPEPQGSVVRHTGRGGGDKRKDMAEPPGGSCETVTEMAMERMGEAREYKLRSWLLRRGRGGGAGGHNSSALCGAGTHPLSSQFLGPSLISTYLKSLKDGLRRPRHPLQTPTSPLLRKNEVLNLRAS